MSKKQNIIIVDDHKLFREGVVLLLKQMDEINVVGEASNGKEFLKLLDKINADLVLMDINMPVMDGIEATKIAIGKNPDIKILALSMYDDQESYYNMVDAGALGFVLKEAGAEELKKAVKAIITGNNFFSQELLRRIILNLGKGKKPENKIHQSSVEITKREKEVLEQISIGKSTKEISDTLNISKRTVENHRANLLSKTNCKSSVSLVLYAIKNKLVLI
ncbi:MAG: response regulator transcription factor [Bacteroidales bacterium]|nr:response regulator transcription factor [Bacteroidales bacterium]